MTNHFKIFNLYDKFKKLLIFFQPRYYCTQIMTMPNKLFSYDQSIVAVQNSYLVKFDQDCNVIS